MKWQTTVLIMFTLIIAVVTLVFFKDEVFSEKVVLNPSEAKGMHLLKVAQDACLSGLADTVDLYAKIEGDLQSGVNSGAGISDVTSKGAVNYLDESIRQIADEDIRACLAPHLTMIKACILGDCQAGALPKTIDFRFTSPEFDDVERSNMFSDIAFFRYQNIPGEKKIVKQDDGFFSKTLALLDKGKTSIAQVSFQVKNGNSLQRFPAKICLQLADPLEVNAHNYMEFSCKANGECIPDELSPKWFDLCPSDMISQLSQQETTHWLSFIIPKAHAQENRMFWAVPSLETLQSRVSSQDLVGIGYTHFTINSDKPLNIDADSYYYDLQVNGQPVLEDGLYSDFNVKHYNPKDNLLLEFGLQNLNFSGRINGCDELSLNIHFLKNGQKLNNSISWQRSYVSLRDARVKQTLAAGAKLQWTGSYKRAAQEYDSEVFVNSLAISNSLQFSQHLPAIKRNQQMITKMKQAFDQAGLMFNGKPLVAVIRPPLTKISYGLAIGIVEDSGQIRYTFANHYASQLLQYVLALRDKAQEFRQIIRHDSFVYQLRNLDSYSQSPTVCWDELAL